MDENKQHEEALKGELKNYAKLDRINNSEEFDTFFKLQINTVAQKMLALFTGDGPKDWDDFCKKRGEVIAMLYPIQQVRGADVMKKQIAEQLNTYYNAKV